MCSEGIPVSAADGSWLETAPLPDDGLMRLMMELIGCFVAEEKAALPSDGMSVLVIDALSVGAIDGLVVDGLLTGGFPCFPKNDLDG